MSASRLARILLIVGLVATGLAIALTILSGTHLNWTSTDQSGSFELHVAAPPSYVTGLLGSLAIVTLLLGSAFLCVTQSADGLEPRIKAADFFAFLQSLRCSSTDKQLAGVCGGLGAHSPVPSWVWRAIFLVLAFCFGTGVVAYIILAVCLPREG